MRASSWSVRELSDQNHEAQFIVSEIRRLIRMSMASAPKKSRSCIAQLPSRVLEEAFRISDSSDPRIVGGLRFYEQRVKDVLAVLKVALQQRQMHFELGADHRQFSDRPRSSDRRL